MDTCGATATLALARLVEGRLELLGATELEGRTTAAMLVPALAQMLLAARVPLEAVEALVVVDGPGSFTGIRIGLSAAKALVEARGLPLFAISRMRVMAEAHGARFAVLDAGRGEFYCGEFSGGVTEPDESLLTLDELTARLDAAQDAGAESGTGASLVVCEEKMAGLPRAQMVAAPTAEDALRVALPAVVAGRSVDAVTLDGRYVRRTDMYRPAAAAATKGT